MLLLRRFVFLDVLNGRADVDDVRREIVRHLAVESVERPKTLFARLDDSALAQQLHMITERGLRAIEALEDTVRAERALPQHLDNLHSIVVTERFAYRDKFLFFHKITVTFAKIVFSRRTARNRTRTAFLA